MLSTNPELAKRIVLCDKPTISEDASTIEPQLLDKLVNNIGMLSSVYYKPPDTFVKKIRDKINERFDLENEDYDGGMKQKQNDEEYIDSMGVKRSEYIKDQPQFNYTTDLLGVEENTGGTAALDDLLGGGS